jgi:hypothetical protein
MHPILVILTEMGFPSELRSAANRKVQKNKFSRAVRRFAARQAQKMGILDHLFTHTICKNLGG